MNIIQLLENSLFPYQFNFIPRNLRYYKKYKFFYNAVILLENYLCKKEKIFI